MQVLTSVQLELTAFGSSGATLHHPVSAPRTRFTTTGPATIVAVQLAAGGRIGRHPAVGGQLLCVTSGQVEISGGDGVPLIASAGTAVVFAPGEDHETRALSDATLAIMEWTDG